MGGEVSGVILWSKTAAGAQRYRCSWCERTFSPLSSSKEARALLRMFRDVGTAGTKPEQMELALFRAKRVRRLGLRKGSAADVCVIVRGVLAGEPLEKAARSDGVDRSTAQNWLRKIALDPAGAAALRFWVLEAMGHRPPREQTDRMVDLMRQLGASY